MVIRTNNRLAIGVLGLMGILAAGIAHWSMSSDIGVIPDSVVYLTNMRTRVVKSYIVGVDGAYHFPALTPNVDYEVYAQHKGLKSETKTLSQFDDRPVVSINLKIDAK